LRDAILPYTYGGGQDEKTCTRGGLSDQENLFDKGTIWLGPSGQTIIRRMKMTVLIVVVLLVCTAVQAQESGPAAPGDISDEPHHAVLLLNPPLA
jgi:hypothetical protein